MNITPLPSQCELRQMFDYNDQTGVLTWKERAFDSPLAFGWNTKYANKIAGVKNNAGYITVSINKKRYLAHRIIWKMLHNTEPKIVDHIDGNRTNNSKFNLREANGNLSGYNKRLPKGRLPRGVQPNLKGFMARLCTKYIGTYKTPEEASAAYQQAAMDKFNFIPN
jgi:hypothetical protein